MAILTIGILIAGILTLILMFNKRNKEHNIYFKKTDEKNFIVNDEFVSFEEDTPLLRFQQDQEDMKHWRKYEQDRLADERKQLQRTWDSTMEMLQKYPKLEENITKEDLDEYADKYSLYLKKIDKFFGIPLSEKHFAVSEKNHLGLSMVMPTYGSGIYTIYNEKNAKYKDGMFKKLEKEFNIKYKL